MSAPEFLFNFAQNAIVVQVTTDANYDTGRFKVRYFQVGTLGPATAILRQRRGNVYQFETLDGLVPDVDYVFELLVFGSGGSIIKSPQLIVHTNFPVPLAQNVGLFDFLSSSDTTLTMQVGRFGPVTPYCMWKKQGDASYTQTLITDVLNNRCRIKLENLDRDSAYMVFAKLVGENGTRIGTVIRFLTQRIGCPTGTLQPAPFGIDPNFTTSLDTTIYLEIDISGINDNGYPITSAVTTLELPGGPGLNIPMTIDGNSVKAHVIGLDPGREYLGYADIINSRGFYRSVRGVLTPPIYDNAMATTWGGFSGFPTYNSSLDEMFFLVSPTIPWFWQIDWCDNPAFRIPILLNTSVVNGTIFGSDISGQTGIGKKYFRATARYEDDDGLVHMHHTTTGIFEVVVSNKKPKVILNDHSGISI